MIRDILIDVLDPREDLEALTKLPRRPRTLDGTLASLAQWQSGFVLEAAGINDNRFSRPGTSSRQGTNSRPGTRGNNRAASGGLRTARLLPVSKPCYSMADSVQQAAEATAMGPRVVNDTRGYMNLEHLLSAEWKQECEVGEAVPEVAELPASQRPASQQARDPQRPIAFGRSLSPPQTKPTLKSKKQKKKMRQHVALNESPRPVSDVQARATHLDLQEDVGKLLHVGFTDEWKAALSQVIAVHDDDDDFVVHAMRSKREQEAWSAHKERLPTEVSPGAYVRHQMPPVPVRALEARETLRLMEQESLKKDNQEQQRLLSIRRGDDIQEIQEPEDEEEGSGDIEVVDVSVITPAVVHRTRNKVFGKKKTAMQLQAADDKAQYEAWRQDVYSCTQRLARHVGNFQLSHW